MKIKENRKRDFYLNLSKELKKNRLLDIEVTVTPFVACALETVPKSLVRELEELNVKGRAEAI